MAWRLMSAVFLDDPAFPTLGYWRGFVWGPMAQLVYWALDMYSHLPLAQQVKKDGMVTVVRGSP